MHKNLIPKLILFNPLFINGVVLFKIYSGIYFSIKYGGGGKLLQIFLSFRYFLYINCFHRYMAEIHPIRHRQQSINQ